MINRITLSALVILLVTAGLIGRLIYLQVVGHAHYTMLSRDNRVKISPLPPTRGFIFDRNGLVLAENVPTYSLELVQEQIPDLDDTLQRLTELLGVTEDELNRFAAANKRHKAFESVPLRLQLTEEDIARFAVKMPFFPGVDIKARVFRRYPYGALTSHIVGYVGRISDSDLQNVDASAYAGSFHIGKTGLEKSYEQQLHGKTGFEEIETNAQGRSVQAVGSEPPVPGANLRLSLDVELQKLALDSLEPYLGSVVALEPSTGRILAAASRPGFDPNPFVFGIRRADYQALQKDPEQPLYNRLTHGLYPPGSTVKPFVALAGLSLKKITPGKRIFCPGYYQLPGAPHRYRDWRKSGHGTVDMRYAIVQSCDVYFYDLARNIGIDDLHDFMAQFGFGERSGVDLDSEKAGLYPSQAWKRRRRKQLWYPGETLIAGIGQGYVQVTPMQLAKAVAALANRGVVVRPHFVDRVEIAGQSIPHDASKFREGYIDIEPAYWKAIVNAMIDVVHSAQGTAKSIAGGLSFHIAGKTGTAQVFSIKQHERYRESRVKAKLRDHAWFIAFAPAEAPRIAVVVLAEHGGHGGSVAAPIARKIINRYLQAE